MPKKLSVLVLTTSFPVASSIAVGIHIIEKCRHLVKNGVKVKVIAPHHAGSKVSEIVDGIIIKRFRYFFPPSLQRVAYGSGIPTNLQKSLLAKMQLPFFMLAFLCSAVINIRHIDIIHCHWSIAGLIGVIAGKLFKKKVVLMIHGAEIFVLGKNPVLKFVLRNADLLICNSTYTEQKVLAVYPGQDHAVIPPGVDLNRFYPQNRIPDLRKVLNISEDEIFVLTIAKFIPRKGIEFLIEAFNIIVSQRQISGIKLRIGGRGPLQRRYQKLIDRYGLNDFIAFLEYIPDDDMASYYTASDIFILPSIIDERGDTEGLGVVLLEANACKTPVIGSNVGGILDVIRDGENGFYVEPENPLDLADKIIKMAADRKLREHMGENGRKFVEKHYNWEAISIKIIERYHLLLKQFDG
jgi:glycosyltransferase involved in cell wall biosynthesis